MSPDPYNWIRTPLNLLRFPNKCGVLRWNKVPNQCRPVSCERCCCLEISCSQCCCSGIGSRVYRVFNTNGDLVLEETNYCNTDTTNDIRNEMGDLTKVAWATSPPNKQVFHIMNYKYDDNGNWIKRERTVESKNGKNKHSIIKRKIEYKKN